MMKHAPKGQVARSKFQGLPTAFSPIRDDDGITSHLLLPSRWAWWDAQPRESLHCIAKDPLSARGSLEAEWRLCAALFNPPSGDCAYIQHSPSKSASATRAACRGRWRAPHRAPMVVAPPQYIKGNSSHNKSSSDRPTARWQAAQRLAERANLSIWGGSRLCRRRWFAAFDV